MNPLTPAEQGVLRHWSRPRLAVLWSTVTTSAFVGGVVGTVAAQGRALVTGRAPLPAVLMALGRYALAGALVGLGAWSIGYWRYRRLLRRVAAMHHDA